MKRLLALLLAAILTLSCCSVVLAEEAAAQDVVTVELALAAKVDHGDWNDFWCLDLIEKECGIRFHVTQYSEDAWAEKKGTMFALDTYPEVFLNDLNDIDLANYGAQGYLLPLEDYITPENMPNVFKVMEEGYPDILKGMTFPDGHIYSFRGVNGSTREYALSRYFVNVSWAEKLNVKVPENLEEFYTYLCAVRDGDPNGNGDTTDEFPISGRYGKDSYTDHFIPILVAFGFLDRRVQANDDGTVMYVPVQENYKEFLKYMNRLWSENLIDPGYFSQTKEQFNAKEASGLIGSFTNHAQWMNNSDPEFYLQYESVDPYTSEFNSVKMWPAKDAIFYGGLTITDKLADKPEVIERLIKFCDWCYSDYGTEMLWRGPMLGTNEEWPNTGWYFVPFSLDNLDYLVRKYLYPTDLYKSNGAFQTDKIKPGNNYWPYATIASRDDNANPTSTSYNLTQNIVTHMAPYYKVGFPATLKYTPEEAEELSLLELDLDTYIATMESKMIRGDLKIDETWDEFVNGCESRNLGRYLEIVQAAYDRYAK